MTEVSVVVVYLVYFVLFQNFWLTKKWGRKFSSMIYLFIFVLWYQDQLVNILFAYCSTILMSILILLFTVTITPMFLIAECCYIILVLWEWNQGVHSSGNIVLSLLTLKLFSMILILPSPIYFSILQNNEYLLHSFLEQIWICQNALNMINLLNISIKLIFKYFYNKRFLDFISCFYLTQVSFNQ